MTNPPETQPTDQDEELEKAANVAAQKRSPLHHYPNPDYLNGFIDGGKWVMKKFQISCIDDSLEIHKLQSKLTLAVEALELIESMSADEAETGSKYEARQALSKIRGDGK